MVFNGRFLRLWPITMMSNTATAVVLLMNELTITIACFTVAVGTPDCRLLLQGRLILWAYTASMLCYMTNKKWLIPWVMPMALDCAWTAYMTICIHWAMFHPESRWIAPAVMCYVSSVLSLLVAMTAHSLWFDVSLTAPQ